MRNAHPKVDMKAVALARRRLTEVVRRGGDFVLVTRLPMPRFVEGGGPQVQATYVGTNHIEQQLEDALIVKRWIAR